MAGVGGSVDEDVELTVNIGIDVKVVDEENLDVNQEGNSLEEVAFDIQKFSTNNSSRPNNKSSDGLV